MNVREAFLRLRGAGLAALVVVCAAGSAGCANGHFSLEPNADEDFWAIRCAGIHGPERQRIASGYAEMLRKVSGLKTKLVQVYDEEDESVIYYGRYRREARADEERFAPSPLEDLNLIRALSYLDPGGQPVWPFRLASVQALPLAESKNAAWDLSRARGWWSLHVAVFYNDENFHSRRYAAEEYCRILRSEGNEAYFHHGPVHSSVCVGLFAKDAIVQTRHVDELTGNPVFRDQIVDPRLLELQRKFPNSYENGRLLKPIVRDRQTGEPKESVGVESFIVLTPYAEKLEAQERNGPAPARP